MTGWAVTSGTRSPRKYTVRPSRRLATYCSTVLNGIGVQPGCFAELQRRGMIVEKALAQRRFLELAGRRARDLIGKFETVGHPPLREMWLQVALQLDRVGVMPYLEHNHGQGPLAPLRVRDGDDGSFRN